MFKKAIKHDAKLRLALCGPAGSGKSFTGLTIGGALAGKLAAVDTEHGSLSKYADQFDFDVMEPDTYDPRELVKTIREAARAGYGGILIDSLSHYWMGKGGELDMVDNATKRSNSQNSFAAWKTVTPHHNELIDTIISAPIHVIVTMRTRTEWVIEENDKGKKTPRKVGLAPVMRDGIEFEFDVCGDLDQENNLTITKSRCPALAGQIVNRPGTPMAETLRGWLAGAPAPEPKKPASAPMNQQQQQPPTMPRWKAEYLELMRKACAYLGESECKRILGMEGFESPEQIDDKAKAEEVFGLIKEASRMKKAKEDAATPAAPPPPATTDAESDDRGDWVPNFEAAADAKGMPA